MPYSYTPSTTRSSLAGLGLGARAPVGTAPDDSRGILGFLGNIAEGGANLARGVGSLVLGGVTDVGKLAAEAVTLGGADFRYSTPELAANLVGWGDRPSAVLEDLKYRYGPLLPGGEPASAIFSRMYEDPLSFGLDALAVGSVGVGAAGKIGSGALRGTEAASTAARVAKELGVAGLSRRTARLAGTRAGLDELAATGARVPEIARRLLPAQRPRLIEGGKTIAATEFANPVSRLAMTPLRRRMTTPVGDVRSALVAKQTEIRDLLAGGREPPGTLIADARVLDRIVQAAEEADLRRIETPQWARRNAWVAGQRSMAKAAAEHLLHRQQRAKVYTAPVVAAIKKDPTVADRWHLLATGLDVEIPSLEPEAWAARPFNGTAGRRVLEGTEASEPVMQAHRQLSEHLTALAALEEEVLAKVANAMGPTGRIRAVRKLLGEARFRSLERRLREVANDPAELVAEVVRANPEGGLLRYVLGLDPTDARRMTGTRIPQGVPAEAGPVFRGIEGVSPSVGTPVAPRRVPRGAAQPSRVGVTASLAAELRDALGGDEPFRLIFEGADTTAKLVARARRFLEAPRSVAPRIVRLRPKPRRPTIFERVRSEGGVSLRIMTGEEPTQGYMVSRPSARFGAVVPEGGFFDPEQGIAELIAYAERHQTELAGPDYLGVWHDVERGEVALDVSMNVLDEGEARRLGIENDQQSIWDVANEREIEVGGTGDRELLGSAREAAGEPAVDVARRDRDLGAEGPPRDRPGAPESPGSEVLAATVRDLAQPPPPQPFGDLLDDAERAAAQAADPIFAERTQSVLDRTDEFIAKLEADREQYASTGWDVDAEIDGARRLARGLADGLRRRTGSRQGGPALDAAIEGMDEFRLVDAEQFADLFGVMGKTPRQIVDRAYFAARMKHGARFDGTELVGGPSVAELDDAFRDGGLSQPVYFPYMDADKVRPSDFFRSRQLRGANIYARDPHAKQLKGVLLREGTYITDPVEALTRRAARATREIETYETMSRLVRETGHRIPNGEEVPTGFVAIAPDALFLHHRQRLELLDEMARLRESGMDADAAGAQVLERVMLRTQDDVAKAMGRGAEVWAVPEVVARQLEKASDYAKVLGGKNVSLFHDTAMNAWRGLVLSGSPRWAINNILGNTVFAAMQGAKTADVMRVLGERFRAMVAGWLESKGGIREAVGGAIGGGELREGALAAQIRRLPGAEHVPASGFTQLTEQYRPELPMAARATATGRAITRYRGSRAGRRLGTWGQAVRHLVAEIDDAYRDVGYLTAAEKLQGKNALRRTVRSFWGAKRRMDDIMRSGFDEASGAAALNEVRRFYGNYGSLTPFERHVMRRFLFPFWSFARHQMQLLLRFPFEYPGRAEIAAALGNAHAEMMEQYGPVPDWLSGALPLGPPGSEVSFLTTRGADPFSGTFQPPLSQLGPVPRTVLEQLLGRELFTGDEFSAPTEQGFKPYGSDQYFRPVLDDQGNVIDVAPTGAPRPGPLGVLAQNVPQIGLLGDLLAGGASYDTAPFTAIPDETGAPLFPTSAADQLARFAGYPTVDYDLASFQERQQAEQERALTEALRRYGISV